MGAVTEPRNLPPTSAPHHGTRARNDLVVLVLASVLVFVGLVRLEVFERFATWSRSHESWQLDEILIAVALLAVALAFYALRRWQDLKREVTRRRVAEATAERLEGLLPICAGCKKIRDGGGSWVAVEVYVGARSEVAFTHGVCPDCHRRLYPELEPSPSTSPAESN